MIEKQTTINDIIKLAKNELRTQKEIILKAFLVGKTGLIMTLMPFSNYEEKEFVKNKLKEIIHEHGANQYFIVMEGWASNINKNKLYRTPSRDVDRKEALIISEFNKNSENKTVMFFFTRKDDKIIFGRKKETNDANSIWDAFVDENEINKKFDEAKKKMNEEFIKHVSKKISKEFKKEFFEAKTEEDRMKVLLKIVQKGREVIDDQNKTIFEDVTEEENGRENKQ